MSDPLGLIGGAGASRGLPPSGGGRPAEGGPSFKEALLREQVNQLQQDATQTIQDLATDHRDRCQCDLATRGRQRFKMLQAVRNKVVEAYQEMNQIRV